MKVEYKNFVITLAKVSKFLRYTLSKRLWMANRLGLYNTVNNQLLITPHPRNFVVKSIAKLKRQQLTENQAKTVATKILTSWHYRFLKKEFIKETVYLMPKFYISFFKENTEFLQDEYYLSLFLSLLDSFPDDNSNQQVIIKYFKKSPKDLDTACLYSNLLVSNQQEKLDILNQNLEKYCLNPILLQNNTCNLNVINLKSNNQSFVFSSTLVSVIVTCFNTEKTIGICIESLLAQTWKNIEIIIVNDASQDNSVEIIKSFIKHDNRVCLVDLPKNVGTFAAKSIGAEYATGEYLTCQDSDDWAHPKKIEEQVVPLINNLNLIATTSCWIRLDSEGNYYSRKYYPFLTLNPASPMFRRDKVTEEMGLWHIVRTGADSEFYERLKLNYGTESIFKIEKPLTLASHRENSLMTSKESGTSYKSSLLSRLDYWESWRLWHIKEKSHCHLVKMPNIEKQMVNADLFQSIPNKLKVNMLDLKFNLSHHIVLKHEKDL